MNRPRLILAVHVFVALGLTAVGVAEVAAGAALSGVINGLAAVAVVAIGVFVARRQ